MCLEVSVNGSDQTAQLVFQGDQVFNIVKVIVLPRQHRLADSIFLLSSVTYLTLLLHLSCDMNFLRDFDMLYFGI